MPNMILMCMPQCRTCSLTTLMVLPRLMDNGYQNSISDTYGFWLTALWVILILIVIVDYFLLSKSMLSESGRLNFHHQIASKIDTSSWIQSVFFNDITVVYAKYWPLLYIRMVPPGWPGIISWSRGRFSWQRWSFWPSFQALIAGAWDL